MIDAVGEELFWRKVLPTGFCWEWTGFKKQTGYGIFHRRGEHYRAHRLAYETLVGPIPDGLVLDHLCRNRSCVNPDHLEPVTQGENARRGNTGIASRLKSQVATHCSKGHEYTEENLRVYKGKHKQCRACQREWVEEKKRSGHGALISTT